MIRIILETDAAAIASRVSRPKADTTDIVINEQTLLSACKLRRPSQPYRVLTNRLDNEGKDYTTYWSIVEIERYVSDPIRL